MAYADLYAENIDNGDLSSQIELVDLYELLTDPTKDYKEDIRAVTIGVLTQITLNPSEVTLIKGINGMETATITVRPDSTEGTEYYAQIKGAFYKMELTSSGIKLGNALSESDLPTETITGTITVEDLGDSTSLLIPEENINSNEMTIKIDLKENPTISTQETVTVNFAGQTASMNVTIKAIISGVTFENPPVEIYEEESKTITVATVSPEDGAGDLIWESNSNKLTVTPVANTNERSATITGVSKTGTNETVTITVRNANGDTVGTITGIEVKGKLLAKDILTINTSATSTAEKSPYVIYPSLKGNILCRVLYNDNTKFEITPIVIIENMTFGSLDETAKAYLEEKLGTSVTDEIQIAKQSYLNYITRLNEKALEYINYEFSNSARCIGGDADLSRLRLIGADAVTGTSSDYFFGVTGRMNATSITSGGGNFSDIGYINRFIRTRISYIGGRKYTDNNIAESDCLYYKSNPGKGYSYTSGYRPVFDLKSNVGISRGAGTESSPYILEVVD